MNDEMELPQWTERMMPTDLIRLINRVKVAKTEEDRLKVFQEWEEHSGRDTYQMVRKVLAGERLPEKDIVMPDIPTQDDRPLEGWAKDIIDDGRTWSDVYASNQKTRVDAWIATCRMFEEKPNDFVNATWFIMEHPAFYEFQHDDGVMPPQERIHEKHLLQDAWHLPSSFDVLVTRVNPLTGEVDDDESLNTQPEVWVEMGKRSWPGTGGWPVNDGEQFSRDSSTHDYTLDCGAGSYELAIITAAVYLHTAYGNDRRICDGPDESEDKDGK